MPGFLEDVRYFLELYRDRNCELILINNANYHCPFEEAESAVVDWPQNEIPVGTIAHDVFVVAQVLERLVTTKSIVLHGHFRGGAVVIEAGGQMSGSR